MSNGFFSCLPKWAKAGFRVIEKDFEMNDADRLACISPRELAIDDFHSKRHNKSHLLQVSNSLQPV